jgi:hypothetical protein
MRSRFALLQTMKTNCTNKQTRLEAGINAKLNQWGREAAINAARAMRAGCKAVLVTYPTGLQMMRFAQPFADYGMHYEVPANVWNEIAANGGKVVA